MPSSQSSSEVGGEQSRVREGDREAQRRHARRFPESDTEIGGLGAAVEDSRLHTDQTNILVLCNALRPFAYFDSRIGDSGVPRTQLEGLIALAVCGELLPSSSF